MIGSPDVDGSLIEVDPSRKLENRLNDFIDSYVREEDNLRFKLMGEGEKGHYYDVRIPKMRLSGGAYAPGLSVYGGGAGWDKVGEDIAHLLLSDSENLQLSKPLTEKGLPVFIQEIEKEQARGLKKDEFNYSMLQLYIMGF